MLCHLYSSNISLHYQVPCKVREKKARKMVNALINIYYWFSSAWSCDCLKWQHQNYSHSHMQFFPSECSPIVGFSFPGKFHIHITQYKSKNAITSVTFTEVSCILKKENKCQTSMNYRELLPSVLSGDIINKIIFKPPETWAKIIALFFK